MNSGTPQEMIEEERDYYKSIGKEAPNDCLAYLIYIIVIVFITFLIW